MSYSEKQQKLRELALLAMSDRELTDEELALISRDSRELSGFLHRLADSVGTGVDLTIRSRARRKILEALSTEELKARIDQIEDERSRILAEDTGDNLSDSFFEAPRIDSDRHLIPLILKSRDQQKVTA